QCVQVLIKTGSSQARWIGILVFLLVISLGELTSLILNYQNNFYLRQYVSDNLSATVVITVGLLVFASGAAYLVSKKLGEAKTPGLHLPVFARIGSFAGRRYKLIIIFWILLFAASLPLSQQLSQVVTSSTGGGQSGNSESARAQSLMAQEFHQPRQQSHDRSSALLEIPRLIRLGELRPDLEECSDYEEYHLSIESQRWRTLADIRYWGSGDHRGLFFGKPKGSRSHRTRHDRCHTHSGGTVLLCDRHTLRPADHRWNGTIDYRWWAVPHRQ